MGLSGKKVFVTGTFNLASDALVARLLDSGAVVADRIAPDVELVIVGADPSADLDAALELGLSTRDAAWLDAVLAGEAPPAPAYDGPPLDSYGPPPEDWEPPDAFAPSAAPFDDDDESPAPARPQTAAPAVANDGEFGKGKRVLIVGGLEGAGKEGEIFWWGESKFGEGMRAGVKGDDGRTYWVDEEHLGWPGDHVSEELIEAAEEAAQFARGDVVRVKSGKGKGSTGTIFWWGESKWGDGMRAGIETPDGEKIWADAQDLEPAETAQTAAPDDDLPF